jgi:hypothetical protein
MFSNLRIDGILKKYSMRTGDPNGYLMDTTSCVYDVQLTVVYVTIIDFVP